MRTLPGASRVVAAGLIAAALILVPATAALACGGLVAPNGTVNLVRTTTLAAYHRGIEHYVTSFTFTGKAAGEVGSIVPLPGVPTKVVKGGDWTLQRLVLETQPQPVADVSFFAAGAALSSARVLMTAEIDALDITVLEGGGTAVGNWARENGFFLPPDAPEMLDFYAERSPIFMAAKFNIERAADQGVQEGQGTPIHVVIPTPDPWVPLRILGLGLEASQVIQADVYLLTDRRPATLPQAVRSNGDPDQRGLIQEVSEEASSTLLRDLRSDRGMRWLPEDDMWLTYVRVNEEAGELTNDLAVDASGFGQPDPVAAGFQAPLVAIGPDLLPVAWLSILAFSLVLFIGAIARRRQVA
ncbi:MAG: DUF2330 domain-containing protein [Actinomycetota bacterium]